LPVINTDLPSGVPFVSRHGETGLTVPPSDPEALARAMLELGAAPERRREMARAARTRAERDFSKETLRTRLLTLYEAA
jgi:rhamnosyl/mannosyltransferase